MTDEELIESLRLWNRDDAADRIEALVREAKAAEKEIANLRENYDAVFARAALKPAPTVTAGWPTEEGEGSIIVGNVKGESHD
jgi:predicted O-methyltransferase YrrM